MLRFVAALFLIVLGVGTWQVTERISTDALAMAVGVFLAIAASVVIGLLLLGIQAAERRRAQAPQRRPAAYRMIGRPDEAEPYVIVDQAPSQPDRWQMPAERMIEARPARVTYRETQWDDQTWT